MIPRPRYFHGTSADIPIGGEVKPATEVPEAQNWDYDTPMFPPGHGGHVYGVKAAESRWRDPRVVGPSSPELREHMARDEEERALEPQAEEYARTWAKSGLQHRRIIEEEKGLSSGETPDKGRIRVYEIEPQGEVSGDPVGGSGEVPRYSRSAVRMPRAKVVGVNWIRSPQKGEIGVQGTLPPINWNAYHPYGNSIRSDWHDVNQLGLTPKEPLPPVPEVLEHAPQFHPVHPNQLQLPFGNS